MYPVNVSSGFPRSCRKRGRTLGMKLDLNWDLGTQCEGNMADKVEFVSDEEIPMVESVKSSLDISASRVCMIVHVL